MAKAYSPTGKTIVCTAEIIPGQARLNELSFERDPYLGHLDWDYEGTTDTIWDGQETERVDDEIVFVDTAGDEWLESQVSLEGEPRVDMDRWAQHQEDKKLIARNKRMWRLTEAIYRARLTEAWGPSHAAIRMKDFPDYNDEKALRAYQHHPVAEIDLARVCAKAVLKLEDGTDG